MARLIRRLRDELGLSVIWIEHAVTVLLRQRRMEAELRQAGALPDATTRALGMLAALGRDYLGFAQAACMHVGACVLQRILQHAADVVVTQSVRRFDADLRLDAGALFACRH